MLTLLCSLLCTNQPNILLIMVDDLGWRDTSVRNGPPEDPTPQLHTPHIQRLADEGMRLDHAYASGCVCTPTRASLLTGAAPHDTTSLGGRCTTTETPAESIPPSAPDWKKEGVQPSPICCPNDFAERDTEPFMWERHTGALTAPPAATLCSWALMKTSRTWFRSPGLLPRHPPLQECQKHHRLQQVLRLGRPRAGGVPRSRSFPHRSLDHRSFTQHGSCRGFW